MAGHLFGMKALPTKIDLILTNKFFFANLTCKMPTILLKYETNYGFSFQVKHHHIFI